ncbi:hypothetical protein CAPTEDRAFT_167017 [Capitella teleta]|uniref:tRNA wybutosine-synthesizing protein 3 homolog n=1 Tax=Capitella teleta TaxID=283909 RepID=R7V909_CAPTE|nr:hypothetical protein CAPTEDRAFT_167017 [Capitella teleta]|eukprot:ELU15002.1 hypothetical protein CAPTEDRAFT_167017 [Capitella teleta]
MERFQKRKVAVLRGVDLSRKGSVDVSILHLVQLINEQETCFTTSSCSGRICLVEQEAEGKVKKKGCAWLYMTHEIADPNLVLRVAQKAEGNAVLKFEGFVLHLQCCDLKIAAHLLSEAVASGFRNSGISVGGKGRITLAVRSTHSLEVPVTFNGVMAVSEEYIKSIVKLANAKMEENNIRIERLYGNFRQYSAKFRLKK